MHKKLTPRINTWVIWAGLALVLVAINTSILIKERLLRDGAVLRLALAPVDPRSLMQGDYMALSFALARDALRARDASLGSPAEVATSSPNDDDFWMHNEQGELIVIRASDGTATFTRFARPGAPLAAGEHVLRYRVRDGRLRVATDAWFFEEGQGDVYTAAKFGEFRVAPNGESILTGMLDAQLHPLVRTHLKAAPAAPE